MQKYILVQNLPSGNDSSSAFSDDPVVQIPCFNDTKSLSLARRLLAPPSKLRNGKYNLKSHALGPLGLHAYSYNGIGIYTFPLTILGSRISTTAGGVAYNALSINPSAASNWSSLASLFDSFRIDSLDYAIIPLGLGTGSAAFASGVLAISVDDDTTGAPASVDDVLQYDNCWVGSLINPPGGGQGYHVPPYHYKCAPSGSALTPATGTGLGHWTDIASVAATGSLQTALELAPVSSFAFVVVTTFYVQFRQIR